jgi:hypothetical protein
MVYRCHFIDTTAYCSLYAIPGYLLPFHCIKTGASFPLCVSSLLISLLHKSIILRCKKRINIRKDHIHHADNHEYIHEQA